MLTPEQQAADATTPVETLREFAQQSVELARIVARNPSANSELLRELATHADQEVCQGVAGNPNVPADILFKLGEKFPKQLLENPLLTLLLLEDLYVLDRLSNAAIRNSLEQENIPIFFLNWVVNHRNLEFPILLAKNRGTPAPILAQLASRAISESSDQSREMLHNLIRNPNTPDNILEAIATREDEQRKSGAWLKPGTNDFDELLANRPNLAANVLEILAIQGTQSARSVISARPETPVALLQRIAEHPGTWEHNPRAGWTRCRLACNPNTPEDILEKLILNEVDPHYARHLAAAKNPNLPDRIVFLLLEYSGLESSLLMNLHLPSTALEKLAKSSNGVHQWLAAKHPNTPMPILMDWLKNDPSKHPLLARNPAVPEKVMHEFSESRSASIRTGVAENPNVSKPLLIQLLSDRDLNVRQAARKALDEAKNSNGSQEWDDMVFYSPSDGFWQ